MNKYNTDSHESDIRKYVYPRYVMLPDNYLYISHLDEDKRFWRIPFTPQSVNDSMSSSFSSQSALARSAPVYTYSHSGPRRVQLSLKMRRDWMDDINVGVSNSPLLEGEDYMDNFIKALQSISVPKYNLSDDFVEPPLVALRLGKEIFIKGIVTDSIGITYNAPILENDKYAEVELSLTIEEVDPYDASSVYKQGSFRGVVACLKNGMGLN